MALMVAAVEHVVQLPHWDYAFALDAHGTARPRALDANGVWSPRPNEKYCTYPTSARPYALPVLALAPP
ncbi:hypothetical protein B0H11DRAFT_2251886 [Mycena galericulata]|nr:hypothetical protein B0H11DRAFT_2251886 [Mycena galericulata]